MLKISDMGAEEDTGGSGKGPGGAMLQFLQEEGDNRVRNPDTGNDVKVKSLKGDLATKLQIKLFQEWQEKKRKQDKKPAKPKKVEDLKTEKAPVKDKEPLPKENPPKEAPPESKSPASGLDPNRFKKVKITASRGAEAVMKTMGIKDKNTLADMLGFSAIPKMSKISITEGPNGRIMVQMEGKSLKFAMRELGIKDGKTYIKNDFVQLTDDAPKGTGTKMLYEQAKAAFTNGIDHIKCSADRWDERGIVGYYVWARLGYDGPIPDDVKKNLPKEFKKAKNVSDLMTSEKGRDWWKENGDTFDATFTKESLPLLEAYMKAKEGKTAAAPNTGDKSEEIESLSPEDEKILSGLWEEKASKKAAKTLLLALKVASSFHKEGQQSTKVDNGVRRAANNALIKAGFDGRGRFRSVSHAISEAFDTLSTFDIVVDDVLDAFLFKQPEGTSRIRIGITNPDPNPFNPPISISNSVLSLSWYEVSSGKMEIIAYLS